MAEARQRAEWDRQATLLAFLATSLSGKEHAPAEFHPLRRDELPGISSILER